MFFKNKIAKECGVEKSVKELTEAAETIAACSKEIQEAAEAIMLSCQIMPGSKGEAHKDLLLVKVDDMEKLALLYNKASERLITAAEKLAQGAPEDEVLSNVIAFNTFFNDQLKSEEKEAARILSMLREDYHDSYERS